MAEKPKGNLFLEIVIMGLIGFLIFTILFPKSIWKKQSVLQDECRSRMEAIQQLEFQYMGAMNTYEDTLSNLLKGIRNDSNLLSVIDTTVFWDGIVSKSTLKNLLMEKTFPQDLKLSIASKLENGQPLGYLAQWDSLEYSLIDRLKNVLSESDTSKILDNAIHWRTLAGEGGYWSIYERAELPKSAKDKVRLALRKDTPIQETDVWKTLRSAYLDTLRDIIQEAEDSDVWPKEKQEEWAIAARAEWEKNLDALEESAKDSIWKANEADLWKKEMDQLWRSDRRTLWKKEGEAWKKENIDTWSRLIEHEWELRTKKEWTGTQLGLFLEKNTLRYLEQEYGKTDFGKMRPNIPDTIMAGWNKQFEAEKDSLWRLQKDSIQADELPGWMKKEKKYVDDTIENIWDRERRITWEPQAYQAWINNKQKSFPMFWKNMKDELWTGTVLDLWNQEEKQLSRKNQALHVLDQAVEWRRIHPDYMARVENLDLPDNQSLWKMVDSYNTKKGSALINLGISSLFRETLLDSITRCPELHREYQVVVNDTATIKKFSIACPIKEKEYEKKVFGFRPMFILYYEDAEFTKHVKTKMQFPLIKVVAVKRPYYEKRDPDTGMMIEEKLNPGFFEKVFGARYITSHGTIDLDGNKSWVKRN